MKKHFINLSLVSISLIVALLLGEIMCRMMLDPANYLSAELVSEPVLGHRVAPESPGYDRWGFRNDSVPDEVDIVAIGDSQTYGNNATKDEAWPQSLGSLIDKKVYNMGVGSYGVVQYYHLLDTKAQKLKPDEVIVGFYMGNDPYNSYAMSYYKPHWQHLQDSSLAANLNRTGNNIIDDYAQHDPESNQSLAGIRSFLSHNSFLYRLLAHGPILGNLKLQIELFLNKEKTDKFSRLTKSKINIDEGFRPTHRANKMDLQNPRIREGFRISLDLIQKMQRICRQNDIKFTVLLIPTKEYVYSNYLKVTRSLNNFGDIQRLLANEQQLIEESKSFFDSQDIAYIDPVSDLRAEIGTGEIYPDTYDDHPTAYGYAVIARSIQDQQGDYFTKSE